MAWCWTCAKSLTEINDDHLLTYACVTKLRYVNQLIFRFMLFSCWIKTGNWRCCKIGFPSETHLRLQFREISFVCYLLFSWQITLKFCTERHSITAVLCVFYKYMILVRTKLSKPCYSITTITWRYLGLGPDQGYAGGMTLVCPLEHTRYTKSPWRIQFWKSVSLLHHFVN